MRKFTCRCIRELDNFNFEVGMIYEGIISAFETGVTILGPGREQGTYLVQGLFEKYFEIV